jgi:broad specificity phosphatase PhoE
MAQNCIMSLYFLRHGQSEANVKRVFAGQKEDSPLTELGQQQAMMAANDLANVHIAKIVSSNLVRARQTADIVASKLGIKNVTVDPRIAEYDMGILTGMPNQTITSLELISAKDAEDPNEFKARVLEALQEYSKGEESVLIVSHAGVGRVIEAMRRDIEAKFFYDIDAYPNAHAVQLDTSWLPEIQ